LLTCESIFSSFYALFYLGQPCWDWRNLKQSHISIPSTKYCATIYILYIYVFIFLNHARSMQQFHMLWCIQSMTEFCINYFFYQWKPCSYTTYMYIKIIWPNACVAFSSLLQLQIPNKISMQMHFFQSAIITLLPYH